MCVCVAHLFVCCRYDLDNSPSGPSYTSSVCPNKEIFGQFSNNVAHSCNEFGLRIWEKYTPFVRKTYNKILLFMMSVAVLSRAIPIALAAAS